MTLSELIQEYEFQLSKNAENALRALDWNYDVDPFDSTRFDRGQHAMNEAHATLKQLLSASPETAEKLWAEHCPYNTQLPTWIFT